MEMCNESGCWEGMLSATRTVMGLVIARKRLMLVHQTSPAENKVKEKKQAKKQHRTFTSVFKFSSAVILGFLEAQPAQNVP